MTGRDDKLPSVLVLAQDGWTAPLRTLGSKLLSATPLILSGPSVLMFGKPYQLAKKKTLPIPT